MLECASFMALARILRHLHIGHEENHHDDGVSLPDVEAKIFLHACDKCETEICSIDE